MDQHIQRNPDLAAAISVVKSLSFAVLPIKLIELQHFRGKKFYGWDGAISRNGCRHESIASQRGLGLLHFFCFQIIGTLLKSTTTPITYCRCCCLTIINRIIMMTRETQKKEEAQLLQFFSLLSARGAFPCCGRCWSSRRCDFSSTRF